ncbi:MAG TPA: class F sortase [Patescibacteria group bacterium]|nr:class F sortase [Patescibacteria group bacterium]
MNKPDSRFRFVKRRLVSNWSSPLILLKRKSIEKSSTKSTTKVISNSRVKNYNIKLTHKRTIQISARRFKTSKQYRSKRYKQIVIPIKLLSTKEIAIRQKYVSIRKSPPKTYILVIKRRVLATYLFVFIGLIGTGYFGYQLYSSRTIKAPSTFSLPTPAPTTNYSNPIVMSRSTPTEIQISKINLDVKTIEVGRLADGSMETPNVLDYVTGWYKYSPTPGELGPSVIVGHVDSYKGISVFWRIRELSPGDTIQITRTDGSTATFKVNAMQQYDQSNFPTQAVYGNISYAGLRLITCGGTFNRQTGHYNENTVVFATLANS